MKLELEMTKGRHATVQKEEGRTKLGPMGTNSDVGQVTHFCRMRIDGIDTSEARQRQRQRRER